MGIVSGFAAIAAASPAVATVILAATIRGKSKSVILLSQKLRFSFLVNVIVVYAILFVRRYWVFLNLIDIPGRPVVSDIYPSFGAVLIDLMAAFIIGCLLSKVEPLFHLARLKKNLHLILFAVIIYPVIVLIGNTISKLLFGQEVVYLKISAPYIFLIIDIATIFIYTLFCGGGMEEPGWRGFLLPYFEKNHGPLVSSLLVSFFWAFWHLPLFLSGDFKGGIIGNIIFVLGIIPMSILLTSALNLSKDYILVPMLLHASFNITSTYLWVSPTASFLWVLLSIAVAFAMIKSWPKDRRAGQFLLTLLQNKKQF